MSRKVLGPVPSVPARGHAGRGGSRAPNPTHVRASSPQGVNVMPGNISGGQTPNTWYDDYGTDATDWAVMKA